MISFCFLQRHLHSTTVSCLATQLFGAPTLLEDSQRYIPVSSLDTLLNFCSKPSEIKSEDKRKDQQRSATVTLYTAQRDTMFGCAHQCSLVCVNAVRSVSRGGQSFVVFVPAVGGRRHAELVLTEQIEAGADKHRARHLT